MTRYLNRIIIEKINFRGECFEIVFLVKWSEMIMIKISRLLSIINFVVLLWRRWYFNRWFAWWWWLITKNIIVVGLMIFNPWHFMLFNIWCYLHNTLIHLLYWWLSLYQVVYCVSIISVFFILLVEWIIHYMMVMKRWPLLLLLTHFYLLINYLFDFYYIWLYTHKNIN